MKFYFWVKTAVAASVLLFLISNQEASSATAPTSNCPNSKPAHGNQYPDPNKALTRNCNVAKMGVNWIQLTHGSPFPFTIGAKINIRTFEVWNENGGTNIKDQTVPTGGVWKRADDYKKHNAFDPILNDLVDPNHPLAGTKSGIDNGLFILQPNGDYYILAASNWHILWGSGKKKGNSVTYLDEIADIAITTLTARAVTKANFKGKPVPAGSDNPTLFPQGSVIIIYDDTPDLAGDINIEGIIQNTQPITSTWTNITGKFKSKGVENFRIDHKIVERKSGNNNNNQ
jgi:hypothetical protein